MRSTYALPSRPPRALDSPRRPVSPALRKDRAAPVRRPHRLGRQNHSYSIGSVSTLCRPRARRYVQLTYSIHTLLLPASKTPQRRHCGQRRSRQREYVLPWPAPPAGYGSLLRGGRLPAPRGARRLLYAPRTRVAPPCSTCLPRSRPHLPARRGPPRKPLVGAWTRGGARRSTPLRVVHVKRDERGATSSARTRRDVGPLPRESLRALPTGRRSTLAARPPPCSRRDETRCGCRRGRATAARRSRSTARASASRT